ncbi:MAG: hypothetical protein EP312_06615 [Gammaproteobacteria bacterium]|nr:MAG: hypothetical protein EP312_06615 [Gammaproteobacteria bacterium]
MTVTPPGAGKGAQIPRPPLHKVAATQTVMLLPLVLALMVADVALAISVLLGGLAAALPQAWFAGFVFREQGARASDRFFARLMVGEATKLSMTALLCALGFQWPAIRAGAFFLAMAGTMVLGWALTLKVLNTGNHAG